MQHLFSTIIHPAHFWRKIKMSELSELYMSMTLKSLALSLIAIFIPVFLYQEGFSVAEISFYFAFYFMLRILFNLLAGYLTARAGPKHMLAYSYVLLTIFLGLLLTLPTYGWSLYFIAVVHSLFNAFFFVAYHVDFSKVHSVKKGGSEISIMNILVRTAAATGPFVGGLVATVFSIEATIAMALGLVLLAIWPLMLTAEPVKKQRELDLKSFSIRDNLNNMSAYSLLAISRQVALLSWPLYISIFIFTDDVYAKVGLVTSVSIAVSILVTRAYGKLIDNDSGKTLLNSASVFASATHALRPVINSLGGVVLINMTSELAETGVLLPFTKGFYDEADSANNRIAYVSVMESAIAVTRASFWLVITWIIVTYGDKTGLAVSFYVASAAALLVMTQKFKALK